MMLEKWFLTTEGSSMAEGGYKPGFAERGEPQND
jgi:hypothetical protein